jgi:hypothetical protein
MVANQTIEKPTTSFILSLISGVLILGGATMIGYLGSPSHYSGMMGGYYRGMMGGYYGMMNYGGWFYGFTALGIVSGLLVLVGAVMTYTQPRQVTTWGIIVLVFSIASLSGGGGFFVGAILGVVGGILALTWKQPGPV